MWRVHEKTKVSFLGHGTFITKSKEGRVQLKNIYKTYKILILIFF